LNTHILSQVKLDISTFLLSPSLRQVAHLYSTDALFRQQLKETPEQTLEQAQIQLNKLELQTVKAFLGTSENSFRIKDFLGVMGWDVEPSAVPNK
jgi:hypothetical protein